jgi:hypothetical protein
VVIGIAGHSRAALHRTLAANGRCGSIATGRGKPQVQPCPQCPVSDGRPEKGGLRHCPDCAAALHDPASGQISVVPASSAMKWRRFITRIPCSPPSLELSRILLGENHVTGYPFGRACNGSLWTESSRPTHVAYTRTATEADFQWTAEKCQTRHFHSITSSARARKDSGMVSPSALAIFRLTMRLYLVGDELKQLGFVEGKNLSIVPGGFASFTQPYQPSPIWQSGRPAHCPFRGLLGVHSRYGLHTRAVTVYRDSLSEGVSHFVSSIAAPVASGWCVRRVGFAPTGKAPSFHGARHEQTQTEALFEIGVVSSLNEKPKQHAGVSYLRG